ncbi:MAG: dienelactone hydrolase family protein [Rubritepida sp.]|jgi:dienelactone hydrolase|nr:dienelactone hydrolase family protein [Rubritepida sp.]
MPRIRHAAFALGLLALAAGGAAAQETLRFPPHIPANLPDAMRPNAPPAQIPGTLRLPAGTARGPAVIILHGSGGVDGRGEVYARALQAAGIATLEVDMWRARSIGMGEGVANRPRAIEALPDAYGALRALAAHPRVDPQRIGVMGMSYGGSLSMLAATDLVGRLYATGGPDFRAALPLYPGCWSYEPNGPYARLMSSNWPRIPLLLMVGDQDDYDADGGASCRRIVAQGSPAAQARGQALVIAGATHGWETTRTAHYRDPAASRGRGGMVRFEGSRAATAESTRAAVAFFQARLAPR